MFAVGGTWRSFKSDTGHQESGVEPHFPIPERPTDCGLVLASSATFKEAERAPTAVGVNTTLTEQLAFGASVDPQVVADCEKSPALRPVIATPEMLSVMERLFSIVTVFATLEVPTFRVPNVTVAGVKETGKIPVPVSAIGWGLLVALSVRVRVALSAPVATGLKEMLRTHVE
jgi:hypothetical protein